MIVDIFIPCFIDQIYPDTGMNMVKILEKLDVGVHYNGNQTCCGQMAFNSGFWDEAKRMGEKFIKDFSNDRPVVGPSASCIGFIKNYYSWLFHNTAYHLEYKQLKKNIYEFTLLPIDEAFDFVSSLYLELNEYKIQIAKQILESDCVYIKNSK